MTKIEGNPWLILRIFSTFRGQEIEEQPVKEMEGASSREKYPGSQVNEPLQGRVLNFSDIVEGT